MQKHTRCVQKHGVHHVRTQVHVHTYTRRTYIHAAFILRWYSALQVVITTDKDRQPANIFNRLINSFHTSECALHLSRILIVRFAEFQWSFAYEYYSK